MNNEPTIDQARALAFQKIGRNIVIFQRVETTLRQLLAVSRVAGTLEQFQETLGKQFAKASDLPMGHLVGLTAKALFSEDDSESAQRDSSDEALFSMSFKLEGGKAAARNWEKELLLVVKERNKLVHRMLEAFDHNSLESCKALSTALDAQRAFVLPVFERLYALMAEIREMHAANVEQLVKELPKR